MVKIKLDVSDDSLCIVSENDEHLLIGYFHLDKFIPTSRMNGKKEFLKQLEERNIPIVIVK